MKLSTGLNPSEFCGGAEISLDGNELAEAIFDYVTKNGLIIKGPCTARIDNKLCTGASVYVDPSAKIELASGVKIHGGVVKK